MSVDTQSPRRPPPRPPKSQYLLHEEAELRSSKRAASRSSSIPYPKGKNPFGESSDEEESAEDVPPQPPPVLRISSTAKLSINPFDDFVSEKELEESNPPKTIKVSEVRQVSSCEEFQDDSPSVPDFEPNGERDEGKSIENVGTPIVCSSIRTDNPSPPQNNSDDLSDYDREGEEDLKLEKTLVSQDLSLEKPIPPKPHKRLAPKPPIFGSTSGLSRDQVVDEMVAFPVGLRRLSTSCENIRTKGPAPPQPVGYKREIRAEGFVKYPKLRREIEEVNGRLSQMDEEIAVLDEKIKHAKDDAAKTNKYTKKRTRLMEKREAISDKHRELINRLQEQVLEDRHADLEFELRNILAKQEHLRTEEEQKRSEELLKLLVEIVEDRDKLVKERSSLESNQIPAYSSPQITESKINGHQPDDVVRSD